RRRPGPRHHPRRARPGPRRPAAELGPRTDPARPGRDRRGQRLMIDLNDYSKTAAQHGWGAGWPSCGGARTGGLPVGTAPRSPGGVWVHRRIARLVALLLAETERRGYLLRPGQCWGYACRAIAGTAVASNHSWGLAVDVNSLANPYQFPRRTD